MVIEGNGEWPGGQVGSPQEIIELAWKTSYCQPSTEHREDPKAAERMRSGAGRAGSRLVPKALGPRLITGSDGVTLGQAGVALPGRAVV